MRRKWESANEEKRKNGSATSAGAEKRGKKKSRREEGEGRGAFLRSVFFLPWSLTKGRTADETPTEEEGEKERRRARSGGGRRKGCVVRGREGAASGAVVRAGRHGADLSQMTCQSGPLDPRRRGTPSRQTFVRVDQKGSKGRQAPHGRRSRVRRATLALGHESPFLLVS